MSGISDLLVLEPMLTLPAAPPSKCITLIEEFDYQGHVCLVSPLLGPSVFDFLKENQYNPFPYSHVQSFARQLLTSVGCE